MVAQGVFSGTRPDCNFLARYAAFMGGRLSFDRSKKHKRNPDGDIFSCRGDKIKPSNGEDRKNNDAQKLLQAAQFASYLYV